LLQGALFGNTAMKELIEKILAHFPQYIGNFGSVLASPTRFLEKQIGPPQDRMSASLTFLAISAVLVVIVGASRRPPGQELWTAVANVAVLVVLGTSLFAVALRIAWRTVGGKATTGEFFVLFAYYYGVAIVGRNGSAEDVGRAACLASRGILSGRRA